MHKIFYYNGPISYTETFMKLKLFEILFCSILNTENFLIYGM